MIVCVGAEIMEIKQTDSAQMTHTRIMARSVYGLPSLTIGDKVFGRVHQNRTAFPNPLEPGFRCGVPQFSLQCFESICRRQALPPSRHLPRAPPRTRTTCSTWATWRPVGRRPAASCAERMEAKIEHWVPLSPRWSRPRRRCANWPTVAAATPVLRHAGLVVPVAGVRVEGEADLGQVVLSGNKKESAINNRHHRFSAAEVNESLTEFTVNSGFPDIRRA